MYCISIYNQLQINCNKKQESLFVSNSEITKTEEKSENKILEVKNELKNEKDQLNNNKKILENFLNILKQVFPKKEGIVKFLMIIAFYLFNFGSIMVFALNFDTRLNKKEIENQSSSVLSIIFTILTVFAFIFCIGHYIVNFQKKFNFKLLSYITGSMSLVLIVLSIMVKSKQSEIFIKEDVLFIRNIIKEYQEIKDLQKLLYLTNGAIFLNLLMWYAFTYELKLWLFVFLLCLYSIIMIAYIINFVSFVLNSIPQQTIFQSTQTV